MTPKAKLASVIAAILIALCTWGYDYFVSADEQVVVVAPLQYNTAKIWTQTRDLTAQQNATRHFNKHKDEFGFRTEEEYVKAAVDMITNKSPDILRNRQKDGDYAYYNPKTGEYAVQSRRGRIRTYFKLDPKIHGYQTNLDYFKAQAKKPANDNNKPD